MRAASENALLRRINQGLAEQNATLIYRLANLEDALSRERDLRAAAEKREAAALAAARNVIPLRGT